MNQRVFVPVTILTGIAVAVLLAALPAIGQKPVPRTADGHPDLSGVWTNATITPLERPRDLAGQGVLHRTGGDRVSEEFARTAQQRHPRAGHDHTTSPTLTTISGGTPAPRW